MAKVDANAELSEAHANTEKEIFDGALEQTTLENTSDTHLEEMGDGLEGDHVADETGTDDLPVKAGDDAKDDKTAGDKDGEGKKPDPTEDRGDPAVALRAERTRRQQVEADLAAERTARQTDIAAMNARLDAALARLPKEERTQTAKASETPDPLLDPEGYANFVENRAEERVLNRNLETSFANAHETHKEKFESAYNDLKGLDPQNPSDRATVQRIRTAANPGKALLDWHQERATLREIGGDLEGFRQRERERLLNDPEFQGLVVERVRGGGKQQQQTGGIKNVTRLPKSLNSAQGGSSAHTDDLAASDNSEGSVFDYAIR